jgi:ankyrin repeat protein
MIQTNEVMRQINSEEAKKRDEARCFLEIILDYHGKISRFLNIAKSFEDDLCKIKTIYTQKSNDEDSNDSNDENFVEKLPSPISPLFTATFRNRPHLLSYLIKKGADMNARDTKGDTALLLACKSKCFKAAKILIENGANLDEKDMHGSAPLHIVHKFKSSSDFSYFQFEHFRLLMEKGADVNITDNKGKTPLHKAVEANDEDLACLLLKKGADSTIEDNIGRDPLFLAFDSLNISIFEELVSQGAKMTVENLFYYIEELSDNTAIQIIMNTKDLDLELQEESTGNTVIMKACLCKKRRLVEFLLSKDVNLEHQNNDGCTALMLACQSEYGSKWRHEEIVIMLLDKGAAINKMSKDGSNALKFAIESGNKEVVAILLERGADTEYGLNSSKTMFSLSPNEAIRLMIINKLIKEWHHFFFQYSTEDLCVEVEKSIDNNSMFKITKSHVELFEVIKSTDLGDKENEFDEIIQNDVLNYVKTLEFKEKLAADVISNYKSHINMLEIGKAKLLYHFPELLNDSLGSYDFKNYLEYAKLKEMIPDDGLMNFIQRKREKGFDQPQKFLICNIEHLLGNIVNSKLKYAIELLDALC